MVLLSLHVGLGFCLSVPSLPFKIKRSLLLQNSSSWSPYVFVVESAERLSSGTPYSSNLESICALSDCKKLSSCSLDRNSSVIV